MEREQGWRDVSTKTGCKEGDEGRKEKRDSLEIQARVWKWEKSRHHGLGTANKGKIRIEDGTKKCPEEGLS